MFCHPFGSCGIFFFSILYSHLPTSNKVQLCPFYEKVSRVQKETGTNDLTLRTEIMETLKFQWVSNEMT